MKHIKKVQVFSSMVNYRNGKDIGKGLAVIIEPVAIGEHEHEQVAQAIKNALEGLKLEAD